MTVSGAPASTGSVAAEVLALLRRRGETLATAESLTGGLIGHLVTDVPGASHSYRGGLVCYATDLKATLAGVDPAVLAAVGPVAPETAQLLALGASRRCGADWGLAVTGVAGPEPQDGHPVGQVFVGLARAATRQTQAHQLTLTGDRAAIRQQTADQALGLLARALQRLGSR